MKAWNYSLAALALAIALVNAPIARAEDMNSGLAEGASPKTASDQLSTNSSANESAKSPVATQPVSPEQSSVASDFVKNLREKASSSYTLWITGSSIEDMDGGGEDKSDLTLDQFFSVGYKVSSKWKLSGTAFWTNKMHSASEGKKNFTWNTPYLTASNSSITKSTKYGTNLAGYVRYYVPVSKAAANSAGEEVDQKNGVIRAVVMPSKTFLDGKLTLSGDTYAMYYLSSGKAPNADVDAQRQWRFYLYPRVAYTVSPSFEPYVAYFNDLRVMKNDKTRGGRTHLTDFSERHLIEIGFNWNATKRLLLNPYMEYGPKFVPKNSTVGLIAEYAFL